jgi:glycosyltransferase involved in cell wall biosynthesis
MSPASLPVTVVVINFQTPDLTSQAVRSLRRFYPEVALLLVDNGSMDRSRPALEELRALQPGKTEIVFNVTNLHHGPAMDLALRLIQTPYVLFLDSDCEVYQGGFLEKMVQAAEGQPRCYAVGKVIFMNDRGFDVAEGAGGHPYVRPICMLINREPYLRLPPFERHGAPCLVNMRAAAASGLSLVHFPVPDYVRHLGRGTASRHGYRLGLKGRINHLLNRMGL